MTISIYSCLIAFFWFDVAVIICLGLYANKWFSLKFGLWPLAIAVGAACLRLAFPVDLPNAFIIRSREIFPAIRSFFTQTYSLGRISFSITTLLLGFWGIGVFVCLASLIIRVRRDCKLIDKLAAMPNQRIQELVAEILGTTTYRLIITPSISTPCMAGWRVPTFILPYYITNFSDDEIRLIVRHELRHFQHHDAWIKLAAAIFICIFWWNLPLYPLWFWLNQFLESDCDLSITKGMSEEGQTEYMAMIQKSFENQAKNEFSSSISLNLFGIRIRGRKQPDFSITQRFYIITNSNKKKNYVAMGAYIVIVAVIWIASLLVIAQPFTYPSELELIEEGTGEVAHGPDKIEEIDSDIYLEQKSDGNYVLYIKGEPAFDYSEEEFSTQSFERLPIIR